MSRSETMQRDSWRVQGWANADTATPSHESTFHSATPARQYYDALDLPAKRLQVRCAGDSFYVTVDKDRAETPEPEAPPAPKPAPPPPRR